MDPSGVGGTMTWELACKAHGLEFRVDPEALDAQLRSNWLASDVTQCMHEDKC